MQPLGQYQVIVLDISVSSEVVLIQLEIFNSLDILAHPDVKVSLDSFEGTPEVNIRP